MPSCGCSEGGLQHALQAAEVAVLSRLALTVVVAAGDAEPELADVPGSADGVVHARWARDAHEPNAILVGVTVD